MQGSPPTQTSILNSNTSAIFKTFNARRTHKTKKIPICKSPYFAMTMKTEREETKEEAQYPKSNHARESLQKKMLLCPKAQ